MKYIITKFFEKQFKKQVSDMSIEDLILKLNVHSKGFIDLKTPFFKIKINTINKTYRILVSYEENKCIILFINIFDKKDKNIGENINWKIHEKSILDWTSRNMLCIERGEYYNILK